MFKKHKIFLCGLVVFCLDQVTKYLAPAFGFSVEINRGISFGLLNGTPLVFVLSIVLMVLVIWSWRLHSASAFPLGMLIGSAASNLVDRLIFGGVRDWLSVPFLPLRNNLADWGIVLALIWLGVQWRHARDSRPV